MTRLGNFSSETLAVDTISADIGLLEKLAACGAVLTEDDLALLARCNDRLTRLLPSLAANEAPSGSGIPVAGVQDRPATRSPFNPTRRREDVI